MPRGIRHPRLVVVTGARSGIGRATALAFAEDGATVLATDIDDVTANETAAIARSRAGVAFAHRLDVTDAEAWEDFADLVRDTYGVPDVLVNNAGIGVAGGFLDHTASDWDRQLDVNLVGVIHGCRVFVAQMVLRGTGGHIVNVGSMNSFTPAPNMSSYSVSKAGVKMLSECLRIELAGEGIGVTVVLPGMINTNIVRDGTFLADSDPDVIRFGRDAIQRAFTFGWDPSRVGRAIVRSVRYNLAIVPVGPEAWIGYWMSRLSPGVVRAATRQMLSRERMEFAMRVVPKPIKQLLAA